jgi:carbonic anhydrase
MLQRKTKWSLLCLFAAVLLLQTACASASNHQAEERHWTYTGNTGPEHWYRLDPAYALAKDGKAQSPINITTTTLEVSGALAKPAFHYSAARYELENNGHTIELVPVEAGNTITLDGADYVVQQFHFHAPSEHTVNGKFFPLELHIVHKDGRNNLAVVGLLFDFGEESAVLDEMFAKIPKEITHEGIELDELIDLSVFFSGNETIYRYDGSLTTPPCSEGVKWNVSSQIMRASTAQLDRFTAVYSGNNRPVQKRNGRTVYAVK